MRDRDDGRAAAGRCVAGRVAARGSAVCAAALALLGCDSGEGDLRWEIVFGSRALGARAALIEARIARGDCASGDVMYASMFAPDDPGASPPALDPGRYAFTARAQDADCVWYAGGCTELELPREGRAIVVELSALGAEALDCDTPGCGAAACRGRDAGGEMDARAPRVPDAASDDAGAEPEKDEDAGALPPDAASEPPPAEPVLIELEAEAAVSLAAPLARVEIANASGGAYISYPYDPAQPLADRRALKRATPPEDGVIEGVALYSIDIPRPGRYRIWGRVIAVDLDEDSFWVRVDDRDWIQWNDIAHAEQWYWVDMRPFEQRVERYLVDLERGAHELRVSYRELGTKLDKIVISSDPDYVPRDP